MMRRAACLAIFLVFILHVDARKYAREDERSSLEDFLPLFRLIKSFSSELSRSISENPRSRRLLKLNNRQMIIPRDVKFPCDLVIGGRSPKIPKSAHEVRPGDIDVIGALGDSLTAGFGASANNILEILSEDRGRSFSIGGQDSWRTTLTLPNILKMFNPNLIGYSLKSSITLEKESQFNVAEGGAISSNMPYMAEVLVKRIQNDPRVKVEKDWKMITLLVGDNDFCSEICYYKNPEVTLDKHKDDLLDVLRILRDNLPKTIVNIIPPLHVQLLTSMTDKPPICELMHSIQCPCLGSAHINRRKLLFDIMSRWQKLDIEVSNYAEFDLDTFTVIPHHFTINFSLPATPQGRTDYTYQSQDCFHMSEKGHSRIAHYLWNSLMEPFGQDSFSEFSANRFDCPTKEQPFIFTRRNSQENLNRKLM